MWLGMGTAVKAWPVHCVGDAAVVGVAIVVMPCLMSVSRTGAAWVRPASTKPR